MKSARRRGSRAWLARSWWCLLIATSASLAIPTKTHTQPISAPHGGCAATPYPICIADDGLVIGNAKKINFAEGITCTYSPPIQEVTCTAAGGGGGADTGAVVVTDAPYNAVCDGATNDTVAFETALTAAAHVIVPAGRDCALCNMDLNQRDEQLLECEPGVILRPTAGCGGANNTIIATAITEFAKNVKIKGCTVRADGVTAAVSVDGRSVRNLTLEGTVLNLVGGGSRALTVQSIDGLTLDGITCKGDGGVSGSPDCLGTFQNVARTIRIRNSTFTGLDDAILLDDAGGFLREISISGSYFDQFWPYRGTITGTNCAGSGQTPCTDSGGDVTYADGGTSVTLTDSDAAFPAFRTGANADTVLILPTRTTGTVTSQADGLRLEDSGANFVGTGVLPYDLVETADAWTVVARVASATILDVDGWRSRTTYEPVASPASGVPFTVYRTLLGHVTSNTATTIVLGTFCDGVCTMFGSEIVPTNGTLYRVINRGTYHLNTEGNGPGMVYGNVFRRGWADQIGVTSGENWLIAGNLVEEGSDGGITVNGDQNLIAGNVIRRNGAAGIHLTGVRATVVNNLLQDNVWVNGENSVSTDDLADIRCYPTTSAVVANNIIQRTDILQGLSRYGVAVRSTAVGCVLSQNQFSGHAANEVRVVAGASNTQLLDNVGLGTVVDAGTNTIRRDSASGVTSYRNELMLADANAVRFEESGGSNYIGFTTDPRTTDLTLSWNVAAATDCSGAGNGGCLTIDASGDIICSGDDGGAGGGGTVTSVDCDTSLVCTPDPITAAGSISRAALTGDVTASAGSNATTIAADAVALGTDTTGTYVDGVTANQGVLLTGTEGADVGLIDCAANEVLQRNGADTQWVCATGGGSFTVAGTSGTPQTISGGDTLSITGNPGISTSATATDQLTISPADDLLAVESLAANGLATRTSASVWTTRSLVQPAAGIAITNADGVAGNPTFALANDLLGVESITGAGLATRTSTPGNRVASSLVAPAAGITITNPDGVAGNPTFVLANDLAAAEGLATTGVVQRTAPDTWTAAPLTLAQLAATCTDAQVVGGNAAGTGLECQTDATGGGAGDITSVGDCLTGACPGKAMVWGDGTGSVDHTYDAAGAADIVQSSGASGSNTVIVYTGAVAAPNTVSLSISNTGTGQAALLANAVGGGDATTRYFTNTGPVNWTSGIDASASGNYVIAAATTLGTAADVLTCTTAGACTFSGALTCSAGATGCGAGGSGDAVSVNGAAATDANLLDGNGIALTMAGASPSTVTFDLRGAQWASSTVCAGTSDASATVEAEIAAATTAGKAYFLPSGCRVGLASPGAGNAAVDIPSGATILCQDQTAGFAVESQRCVGGNYPGAACSTSTECTGGGTCTPDFGGASANPCTGTECFAPSNGSTYTMLKDTTAGGSGVVIQGCTFWTYQAEPYQRCSAGTFAGRPCRQELDGGSFPGFRCEADAGGGTCLRVADCAAGGGGAVCTGMPLPASGLGSIVPIDLNRIVGAQIRGVRIVDHFEGPSAIIVAANAIIADTDLGAEVTNCTSPLPATPATSGCTGGAQAGGCCYGAAGGLSGTNTQPTVAVVEGIDAGYAAQIVNTKVRGSTWALDIETSTGEASRVQSVTVLPTLSSGPGTASAGVRVGAYSTVESLKHLLAASGTTAISLTGVGSSALSNVIGGTYATGISITGADGKAMGNVLSGTYTTGISGAAGAVVDGNTLGGTAWTTGINLTGTQARASKNILTGLNTASAIGILMASTHQVAEMNAITGNSTTGIGISATGAWPTMANNSIISSAANTLQYGIKTTSSGLATITGNHLTDMLTACVWLAGGNYNKVIGNDCAISVARPTAALQPVHILSDSAGNQGIIANNAFAGGWRGISGGTVGSSLGNTLILGNRFNSLSGAPGAIGGAGISFQQNYINAANGGGPTLTCDAACSDRGELCQQDSDCTSCTTVEDCVPEPIAGFIGSPTAVNNSTHNSWQSNLLFDGRPNGATKQCGGTTTWPGSLCQTAANTCAGGASCTGGPPGTCATGAEAGKTCCPGGAPTCTVRTPTPFLRVVDYGSATTHSDATVAGNIIFGGQAVNGDVVGVDFASSASLGNITADGWSIVANVFSNRGAASNVYGIKFATSGTFTDINVNGNNFNELTDDVLNYKGTYGEVSFVPSMVGMASDQAVTSTTFVDITALKAPVQASRLYDIYCHLVFVPGALGEGSWYGLNGPAGATLVSGRTCVCDQTNDCTTSNVNNYRCQHFNAYNTGATTTGMVSATAKGAVIEAILNNGTTAGTLVARALTESATGTTIKAGSFCRVSQMAKGS